MARRLLLFIIERLLPEGEVVIGIDDTIERRWGMQIAARGIYRDPIRSSKGFFVKTSGLGSLSLMVVVPIPWAGRSWALPFLTILVPSAHYSQENKKRYKTLTAWARQAILQTRRWLTMRRHACMITRLRLHANLFRPAPPRQPGQRGRTPLKGVAPPKLSRLLKSKKTVWTCIVVSQWYNARQRSLHVATGTAVWYHSGLKPVPIRWVLVRDPSGEHEPSAFLSTDPAATPAAILGWFVSRWRVETTFQEVRTHLGVETQRQWSDMAILPTTPALLGLFSLITVWADDLARTIASAVRLNAAAWYYKQQPAFSDAIAAVCSGRCRIYACPGNRVTPSQYQTIW